VFAGATSPRLTQQARDQAMAPAVSRFDGERLRAQGTARVRCFRAVPSTARRSRSFHDHVDVDRRAGRLVALRGAEACVLVEVEITGHKNATSTIQHIVGRDRSVVEEEHSTVLSERIAVCSGARSQEHVPRKHIGNRRDRRCPGWTLNVAVGKRCRSYASREIPAAGV